MSLPMKFLKSAVLPKDYPPSKRFEIAISGRSNAGKSSFINSLGNQKIAKVSGTPGKTRLLNFFEVGQHYNLVDMPGYGYAARGNSEIIEWQQMIESYLMTRPNLAGLILVMDIRREWSEEEEMIAQFSEKQGFPIALILTKSDKINKNEIQKAIRRIETDSGMANIFAVSSTKNTGVEVVEEFLFSHWVKPHLSKASL